MAFIAKIDPLETVIGQNIRIDERAMYDGNSISSEDPIFIWTSETSGGRGLVAIGRVTSATITGSSVSVDIRIEATVRRQLGVDEISPCRDLEDDSPESELARILYRQAHNKVAAVGEITREFLQQHFA